MHTDLSRLEYVCTYLHTQRRGKNSCATSSKRFGPGGSDGGDALCVCQTPEVQCGGFLTLELLDA